MRNYKTTTLKKVLEITFELDTNKKKKDYIPVYLYGVGDRP